MPLFLHIWRSSPRNQRRLGTSRHTEQSPVLSELLQPIRLSLSPSWRTIPRHMRHMKPTFSPDFIFYRHIFRNDAKQYPSYTLYQTSIKFISSNNYQTLSNARLRPLTLFFFIFVPSQMQSPQWAETIPNLSDYMEDLPWWNSCVLAIAERKASHLSCEIL